MQFVFCVLFFLIANPYQGIWDDGNLYLLQAVRRYFPERFDTDIVFMFGNQDSFSLFSPWYAWIIKMGGVVWGTQILVFLFMVSMAIAFYLVVARASYCVGSRRLTIPLFLGIILLFDHYRYGPGGLFSLIEPLAIARVPAEIFCLLGLAYISNKRNSLLLNLAGFLLHPLTGAWGVGFWLFYHYPKAIKIALLFALVLPFSAYLGIWKFDQYDVTWGNYAGGDFGMVEDYFRVGVYVAFIFLALRFAPLSNSLKKIGVSCIALAEVAYYLAFAGPLTKNVLLMQFQPARFEWFLSLIAKIAFGLLLYGILLRVRGKIKMPLAFWKYLNEILLFVAAIVGFLVFCTSESVLLNVLQVVAIFTCLAMLLAPPGGIRSRMINICFGFLLLVMAVVVYESWDVRDDMQRASETELDRVWNTPLFPEVEDRGRIFFHVKGLRELTPRVQFLSGSYVDYNSDAGALFFRDQYLEFKRRTLLVKCGNEKKDCGGSYSLFVQEKLHNVDTLRHRMQILCEKDEIDYIITDERNLRFPEKNSAWLPFQKQTVYLYGCPEIKTVPKWDD